MTDRRRIKGLLKICASLAVISAIAGYGLYRAKTITEGPQVSILSPLDGSLLSESLVTISGTAKNISFLNLNGAQIFTDENGKFEEKILLSYGYNVITLEAKDRFGRKTETKLQLIYK